MDLARGEGIAHRKARRGASGKRAKGQHFSHTPAVVLILIVLGPCTSALPPHRGGGYGWSARSSSPVPAQTDQGCLKGTITAREHRRDDDFLIISALHDLVVSYLGIAGYIFASPKRLNKYVVLSHVLSGSSSRAHGSTSMVCHDPFLLFAHDSFDRVGRRRACLGCRLPCQPGRHESVVRAPTRLPMGTIIKGAIPMSQSAVGLA
jgi:hypothetical protein